MDATTTFAALYRERVLDHGRSPRHAGVLPDATHSGTGHNPLCGDRVRVQLRLGPGGRIAELRHASEGCLLCLASVSLMAGDVLGRDAAGVAGRLRSLRAAITRGDGHDKGTGACANSHDSDSDREHDGDHDEENLGELAALAGVSAHPARHRCVLLPWESLQRALAGEGGDA